MRLTKAELTDCMARLPPTSDVPGDTYRVAVRESLAATPIPANVVMTAAELRAVTFYKTARRADDRSRTPYNVWELEVGD